MKIREPAARPCGSCPYRCDVPGGVWDVSEYDKLPEYDKQTFEQPIGVFLCHQQDGRACAGWVATHDMEECLALRVASSDQRIDNPRAFIEYETDVEVFASGSEAAVHGIKGVFNPDHKARAMAQRLKKKQERLT